MAKLDECKRIMQVLWLKKDAKNCVTYKEVRIEIYKNCGIQRKTEQRVIKVLRDLGWLKRKNREQFIVSSDYLTQDF